MIVSWLTKPMQLYIRNNLSNTTDIKFGLNAADGIFFVCNSC